MRADPYHVRARALAVEAGLDPDAKIDRSGQRPMPTWCTFAWLGISHPPTQGFRLNRAEDKRVIG